MRSTLCLAALAIFSGVLHAQTAPVKMGLWEKKMTMDVGTGTSRAMNSKSCVTPETWQEMVGNVDKQHEGCTVDRQKSDRGYSFTATCKTDRGTMVTTGHATIQDSEHIVAESHSEMTTNGQKRTMEMKSTSTFLGADCGAVKPGDPEME